VAKDKTISYRPDPEILAQIEAAQQETGKKYLSEVLAELVKAGLEARKQASRPAADSQAQLGRLVELLEGMKPSPAAPGRDAEALGAIAARLDRLPAEILEEVDSRLRRLADLVADDLGELRKGLRTAVANFVKVAYPKLEPDKIAKLVNDAFDN